MKKKNLTILIIEDNPDDQLIYQRYLKKDPTYTYTVYIAETGKMAVQLYVENRIDCILLDYNLPDYNGLELLQELTSIAGIIKAPVIFLTGEGNETIAVEAMKRGASDYLIKNNVNSYVLVRTIRYGIKAKIDADDRKEHLIFLEALLDTIPNPVFYKDTKSIYRGCNVAFAKFVGKTKSEIIGSKEEDIIPKRFAEKCQSKDYKLIKSAGVDEFEETFEFPDGSRRYLIVNKASYTNINGQVEGLVGVFVDITERRKAEQRIKRLALYDDLTGLPNRRLFFERLSGALARAKRNNTSVAILYFDLNQFKPINDTYGHEAGDAVLHKLGERVRGHLREMDTAARLGGDEFAIILPDLGDTDGIMTVARKIVSVIDEPIIFNNEKLSVFASIGISIYPQDAHQMDELIKKADMAMYSAKKMGNDLPQPKSMERIMFYSEV